ncbi:hypothetical protein KFL_010660040 [Klebsormidium nitens]|uniref:Uncharacterized protein n=1 Tax=Klebsormidium nitens TaxID=105231 RepID=A0A1Y1IST9_KLENI|nr:hypothetical protein KFL_010660040 [Klebsormidium nitens]|eukprot:GAQ92599.1 hypothetical protein KFL_010660040 [Klebsormidium nitens]
MASSGGGPAADGKGTTRLDRLLTLLDTGSTPATRRNAAQQIGELAGLHKEGLRALLAKIHRFLRSKKWDTRVAAGQAVGAIAQHVPHVTVESLEKAAKLEHPARNLDSDTPHDGAAGTFEGPPDSGLMQFSRWECVAASLGTIVWGRGERSSLRHLASTGAWCASPLVGRPGIRLGAGGGIHPGAAGLAETEPEAQAGSGRSGALLGRESNL